MTACRGSGAIRGRDKLQMAGLTTGYDRVVVRGDRGQGRSPPFATNPDKLVGIESVNRAGDHMFGRRLLGRQRLDHAGAGGRCRLRSEERVDLDFGDLSLRKIADTSSTVGIEGAAPIRSTQMEAAILA